MVSDGQFIADTKEYRVESIGTSSLPPLLDRVSSQFAGEGTLLIEATGADALGLPLESGDIPNFPGFTDMHGWNHGKLSDWTIFSAPGRPTVVVGIVPLTGPGRCTLLDLPTAGMVVEGLKCWHDLTGRAWHHTPGVAGLSVLRSTFPTGRRSPTVKPKPVDGAYEKPYYPDDFRGTPGQVEVLYDKTRAYIGAAGTVRVASHSLVGGPKVFDGKLSGWWRVKLGPWNEDRLPNPAGYGDPGGASRWVTTPTLELLQELAESNGPFVDFQILESKVSREPGRQLLKSWSEKMRDAYDGASLIRDDTLRNAVRGAVKDAGRETLGLLASPGNWLYRPDWWAAVQAQHRCNMFRSMLRVGQLDDRWPVEVKVDGVWYPKVSEDPARDVPSGFKMGDKLGCWKRKGVRTLRRAGQ
jgi:hypothetical protein